MVTSSHWNAFRITGLCKGNTGHRWFLSQTAYNTMLWHIKKLLSRLSSCEWFGTPWRWYAVTLLSLTCDDCNSRLLGTRRGRWAGYRHVWDAFTHWQNAKRKHYPDPCGRFHNLELWMSGILIDWLIDWVSEWVNKWVFTANHNVIITSLLWQTKGVIPFNVNICQYTMYETLIWMFWHYSLVSLFQTTLYSLCWPLFWGFCIIEFTECRNVGMDFWFYLACLCTMTSQWLQRSLTVVV